MWVLSRRISEFSIFKVSHHNYFHRFKHVYVNAYIQVHWSEYTNEIQCKQLLEFGFCSVDFSRQIVLRWFISCYVFLCLTISSLVETGRKEVGRGGGKKRIKREGRRKRVTERRKEKETLIQPERYLKITTIDGSRYI